MNYSAKEAQISAFEVISSRSLQHEILLLVFPNLAFILPQVFEIRIEIIIDSEGIFILSFFFLGTTLVQPSRAFQMHIGFLGGASVLGNIFPPTEDIGASLKLDDTRFCFLKTGLGVRLLFSKPSYFSAC